MSKTQRIPCQQNRCIEASPVPCTPFVLQLRGLFRSSLEFSVFKGLGIVAIDAKSCIFKLRAISQAGRRRFDPGLPLHNFYNLRGSQPREGHLPLHFHSTQAGRHSQVAVVFRSVRSSQASLTECARWLRCSPHCSLALHGECILNALAFRKISIPHRKTSP